MSLKQLSHSNDIDRLLTEGFELEVRDGCLLIHHVPYVNKDRQVMFGVLVSELNLVNPAQTAKPAHTIQFCGDPPCDANGSRIQAIYYSTVQQELSGGLMTNHMFSNKPPDGYPNYYEKISTYVNILSGPAKLIEPGVTAHTFRVYGETDGVCVFKYADTNASRARIISLNKKFSNQRIAIVGMGGTGAYILDAVAKTPVPEIHLFDGKPLHQHNAFRSPGAVSVDQLNKVYNKATFYQLEYSQMREGIFAYPEYIIPDNLTKLKAMSFVFICVDRPEVKKYLLPYLLKEKIPFIDVGMGLHLIDDVLIGTLRVTAGIYDKYDHLEKSISMEEDQDNDYNENIQIAELNSMNAAFAVIKWKKMIGFYQDHEQEFNLFYTLNTSQLTNDDYRA